jgi:hypothetical protein
MGHTLLLLWSIFSATVPVQAFFDEIAQLKTELQAWQTTHAADFTDVVDRLTEMTGPLFNDVTENDWFYPYVSSVAEWGIITGYKTPTGQLTGQFKPGNSVTIAETLKMALKGAKIDESQCKRPVLNPSAKGHWAEAYVSCAEEMGIRLFQFNPDLDRPALRGEVVSIINDAWGDKVPPLYANFKDTASHRFEADIAFAAARGIVSGDKDANGIATGYFRPDDKIVRAEVTKIIYERLKAQVREEKLATTQQG